MSGFSKPRGRRSHGFTLIELLVVVSIISLLIGILLPTLGQAVQTARQVVCGTTQRGLMQGMILWSGENKDKIPGLNGTWVPARNRPDWEQHLNSDPGAPVQSTDWMSAALKGEDLPANRAQRFLYMLNTYRCPEQQLAPVWPQGGAGAAQVRDLIDRTEEDVYAVSYMMSAYFQWSGREGDTQVGSFPNYSITEYGRKHTRPVEMPRSYRFNLNQIGSPATKAGLSDATRFREATGLVNTEVTYQAGQDYGSFAHSTPVYNNSGAFVRARSLSYRHGGKISAAYFDGHVGVMNEEESRNPTPWFPAGSIFNGENAHEDAFKYYQEGQTVN
jgi:prepilin-type N-terminal cleavage/methylation domain-containing protein/prepilin-type processing-associated H-X9-DG protein